MLYHLSPSSSWSWEAEVSPCLALRRLSTDWCLAGDVQPFIPIAHKLQKAGHRIRLGTHSVFKDFVLEQGLEFFDIGGDPAELMAYMGGDG